MSALPNPYTPMAFLPEVIALKITIQTYAAVGSLGVSYVGSLDVKRLEKLGYS